MSNDIYPKVLVIGNNINMRDGGGITFSNLFRGWPKDKISVASSSIDADGIKICEKYYRIGYKETRRPWPLNKLQPYYRSTEVIILKNSESSTEFNGLLMNKSKYNARFKKVLEYLLHCTGLYFYLFPIKASKSLLDWISDEKPDIIYTQLSSVESILLVNQVVNKLNLPLAIHVMDDWFWMINKPGFAWLYWNRRINKVYRNLIKRASCLMSICESMSEEYKKRYNSEFIPFHNCIELEFWRKAQRSAWEVHDTFKVLYAGRIGKGTSNSVLTIAKAVELLGNSGVKIEFQIQSPSIPEKFELRFSNLTHTKLNPFIPYPELPKKLSSADLLVLPMDFDSKNLRFIHLSMPTKVPEYAISGTPILVFGHNSTALVKYARKEGWASVVSDNNLEKLKNEILELVSDQTKRQKLAQTAVQVAQKNHYCSNVRQNFKENLFRAIE